MAFSDNVSFCRVTYKLATGEVDSFDAGQDPDAAPIAGQTIRLRASVPRVVNATATPPVTHYLKEFVYTTNLQGELVNVDGTVGAYIIATDDPDLQPTGWTWTAVVSGNGYAPDTFSFVAPSGGHVDLSTVPRVPLNPGSEIAAWAAAQVAALSALAGAEAARDEAVELRDEAAAFAGTNNQQVATMLRAPGTPAETALSEAIAGGVSVLKLGLKGDGATDDTAALVAADASVAWLGASLYFPAGDYKLSSGIIKNVATSWVGEGVGFSRGNANSRSTRFIFEGPTSGWAVEIRNASNVGILGIEFSAVGVSADTLGGLYINGAAEGISRVERCAFLNFSTGVKVGTSGNWIQNNWFQSCGIPLDISGSENHIIGNHGYGDSNTGSGCAILVRSSANMIVANKFFGDGAKQNFGIVIWGYGNTVTANVLDAFLEAGIVIRANNSAPFSAGNPASDANVIIGNNVSACGNVANIAAAPAAGTYNAAILVLAVNADATNVVISGNTIFNKRADRATEAGIYLVGGGHAVRGVKVLGNNILNTVTTIRRSGTVTGVLRDSVDEVTVTAAELGILGGAPSLSQLGGIWTAWMLDAASAETVGGEVALPEHWVTFDVIAEAANAAAGTGDHSLRLIHSFRTAGDTLSASFVTGPVVTTVAAAQDVAQHVVIASGLSVTAGKRLGFAVGRRAAEVADTLTNDLALSAVIFRRAT